MLTDLPYEKVLAIASRHTAVPCNIPSRLDAIFQPSYPFFNPKANPRCVRLLGIIKYLAVPNSLGSCCKYLMSPLDTVEVWGSSSHGPTIQNKDLALIPKKHSGVQKDTLFRPICVLF